MSRLLIPLFSLILHGVAVLAHGFDFCPVGPFQESASAMTKPSFYRLCERSKLLNVLETVRLLGQKNDPEHRTRKLLGVEGVTAWSTQVQSAIRSALETRESLVQVESQILDLSLNQFRRVSGLGTVIVTGANGPLQKITRDSLQRARYFVLTAAHLVSGSAVTVTAFSKAKLPLKQIYLFNDRDLALIELDSQADAHALPFPLGYWISNGEDPFLLTYLGKAKDDFTTETPFFLQRDEVSRNIFRIYTCDSFWGAVGSHGAESGILTPEWIKPISSKCHFGDKEQISRDPKTQTLSFDLLLRSGLSGAPIVIPYPLKRYDEHLKRFFYVVGGVVTTISREFSQSSGQARGLHETLQQVVTESPKEHESINWYLIDDIFISTGETLDLYIQSEPIGNGIIIEGFRPPDEARAQFEKYLESRGVGPQDRLQLESVIRDLRATPSDSKRRERLKKEFNRISETTNLRVRNK